MHFVLFALVCVGVCAVKPLRIRDLLIHADFYNEIAVAVKRRGRKNKKDKKNGDQRGLEVKLTNTVLDTGFSVGGRRVGAK